MLRSYLTTALKVIRKNGLYSAIKIVGLAIGLAAFFLIGAFVRFELSYDRFHEKADRTYRVFKEDQGNYFLGSNRFAVTPAPLERALPEEIPQVEVATQVQRRQHLLTVGQDGVMEYGLIATPSFFDVFSFPVLSGDAAEALSRPEAILLTPKLAVRLFGSADPLGRTVGIEMWEGPVELAVAGIVEAPPTNSHLQFDYIIPMSLNPQHAQAVADNSWGSNSYHTYVVLHPEADPEAFRAQLADMGHRHLVDNAWYDPDKGRTTYFAEALTDLHLRSDVNFQIGDDGDIRHVWLFGLIALAILLTAAVNYTNLSTARAATRAREIGVRKAAGAHRSQLVGQFLGESVVMALLAALLSFGIVLGARPFFSGLVDRAIPLEAMLDLPAVLAGLVVAVVVGLLAGAYPALVLSRFQPAVILKGRVLHTRRSRLRSALVVGQFAVGVILVFGTIVVTRQVSFMGTAETGMDRDQVLAVQLRDRSVRTQWAALSGELRAIPGVLGVTNAGYLPTSVGSQQGIDEWTGNEEGREVALYTTTVGYDYIELLGLEMAEGRPFSPEHTGGGETMIINESAMRALGWDSAVGKEIGLSGGTRIVGVVKDFHFHSFRQQIAPLGLVLAPDEFGWVLLKVRPDGMPQTVRAVGEVVDRFSPTYPYDYQFLDDAYNAMYQSDRRLASIFVSFSMIALIIACLGLLGLAAFMVQVRTKEIGVRKVLGARPGQITSMMMRELARPVLAALAIGCPIAWYAVQRWLDEFAYRVEPGVATAAAAGLTVLLVAGLTVGWQSWRAARADPARVLRTE